jgi:SAM-dependent methyltransferase
VTLITTRSAAPPTAPHAENLSTTTNPNKTLWEKGDFTRLAACMRESGDELIDTLGVQAGLDVLDLGCGDGTTALPSAYRGAKVLGVDIAANLVAAGNVRAREAGLSNLRFEEGDASHLDALADDSFDLVVTIFGAMFAPRPLDTAAEMVRVTRPGGRIVMGNWIPGDPTLIAHVLKICAAYTPPPPEGFISPVTWGQEDAVRERFGAAGIAQERISCERATYVFRYAGTPREFLAIFRDYYGPTMNAFAAAEASGHRAALQTELEQLFERENRGGAGRTEVPATYLKVIVRK